MVHTDGTPTHLRSRRQRAERTRVDERLALLRKRLQLATQRTFVRRLHLIDHRCCSRFDTLNGIGWQSATLPASSTVSTTDERPYVARVTCFCVLELLQALLLSCCNAAVWTASTVSVVCGLDWRSCGFESALNYLLARLNGVYPRACDPVKKCTRYSIVTIGSSVHNNVPRSAPS